MLAGFPLLARALLPLLGPRMSPVRIVRDFAYFVAYVAGLLPLPAVFFAGFFANVAGLFFAYLAALLEASGLFFPSPLFSLLVVVHRSPPHSLRNHDNR